MRKLKNILPATLVALLAPAITSAQGLKDAGKNLEGVAGQAGLGGQSDLATLVGGIIQAALSLIGLIFFILMVYAGYYWMTARGEESRVEKAKDSIKTAIIGLIIVMLAYAITTFVTTRLSNL